MIRDLFHALRSVSAMNRLVLLPLILYAAAWALTHRARIPVALALLLLAAPVHADTIYTWTGDPFGTVTGSYTTADRIVGHLAVAEGFIPEQVAYGSWRAGILAWDFSDGHIALTEENSTLASNVFLAVERVETIRFWVDLTSALGSISVERLIDYWIEGRSADGSGLNCTMCGVNSGGGLWTVAHTDTVSVPELAILPHLPRLLKWGLGLGLEARVTHVLQHATARLAATILWAPRDGVFIDLPHARIEVAEACSGIATLALLIAVGVLLAIVQPRLRWAYIVGIVVAAALLALEANALRVVLIALGGEHRDSIQYATTALAVGQLVLVGRWVK